MITGSLAAEASPLLADRAASAQTDAASASNAQDDALRAVAKEFETMFIAEMLKAAKVGETKGPFTGGHGEEAFRSFLVREYAGAISDQGGFGLADQLYQELKEKVAANG